MLLGLGNISDEIYLWHFPIQLLIKCCDMYFGLGIDYSSVFFPPVYVMLLLGVSLGYKVISKKYENVLFHIVSKVYHEF